MKGIAHFTVGVAAAACFPAAVTAAEHGNPLYFILGGVFGLLPDTIDFKLYRFFYRHDAEVVPDPLNPDPQMIADAAADAVNRAADTGKPFRIRFNTVRLGADLWQRYSIKFNLPEKQVEVVIGPKVDTGGTPVGNSSQTGSAAAAPLDCPVRLDYLAETDVDIFEGPIFQMTPTENGYVVPQFIPWHRRWSHSFIVGAMFALPAWYIWDSTAAFVIVAAYSAHVAVDQLGYMGSNLFWPFSRKRTQGLKLQHSGESFPNFYAIWLACLLIYINLAQGIPQASLAVSPAAIVLWGIIIPPVFRFVARRWLKPFVDWD